MNKKQLLDGFAKEKDFEDWKHLKHTFCDTDIILNHKEGVIVCHAIETLAKFTMNFLKEGRNNGQS